VARSVCVAHLHVRATRRHGDSEAATGNIRGSVRVTELVSASGARVLTERVAMATR